MLEDLDSLDGKQEIKRHHGTNYVGPVLEHFWNTACMLFVHFSLIGVWLFGVPPSKGMFAQGRGRRFDGFRRGDGWKWHELCAGFKDLPHFAREAGSWRRRTWRCEHDG